MLFRKYASAAASKPFSKFKGRPNGRLNYYNFEKYVRKPYSEKIFRQSVDDKRSKRKYNAYDTHLLTKEKMTARRMTNLLRSPASSIRKEFKSGDDESRRQVRRSPLRQLQLGSGGHGKA